MALRALLAASLLAIAAMPALAADGDPMVLRGALDDPDGAPQADGGAAPRLMHSQPFANLRVGAQQEIRLGVPGWRVSQEFPPTYEFVIEYDPDIAVDGNRANDDCRSSNNRRTIRGDEINAQLRASGR